MALVRSTEHKASTATLFLIFVELADSKLISTGIKLHSKAVLQSILSVVEKLVFFRKRCSTIRRNSQRYKDLIGFYEAKDFIADRGEILPDQES